ncbi:hypothetical protein ACNJD8_22185, partial [Mycobacterium tuberculosis]
PQALGTPFTSEPGITPSDAPEVRASRRDEPADVGLHQEAAAHLDEFGVRQTTIAQPFDDGSGTTARDASPTGPSPSLNTKRSAEGRDGRRSTRATDSLLLLVLV